jgi:hypothetical protein
MFEHETGKGSEPLYEKEHTAYVMSCGAEFRGRREGRVKKGVKNLKGSKAIPQNLFSLNWKFLPLRRKRF